MWSTSVRHKSNPLEIAYRWEKKLRKLILAGMLAVLVLIASAPVFGQVAFEIGDTENESGDVETENSSSIEGNNNACLGQSQFGNSGNFTNQQSGGQFFADANDLGLEGGEISCAPEKNETVCDQAVQQSAAASSS